MPSRLGKSYKEPWLIVCAVLKVCLSVPFLRSSLNIYYVLSSHHRAAKNFPVLLHYLQNKIPTTYPYIRGLTLVILFPIFPQPQPTHTHTHTCFRHESLNHESPHVSTIPSFEPILTLWYCLESPFLPHVINILQPLLPKHKHINRFAAFTDFHGGNTPIMANFNWLMWCHWMQSWEEMSSDPPWWNISMIIS